MGTLTDTKVSEKNLTTVPKPVRNFLDVVAGAEVTDPGRVREAVDDGACGTALHDHGVRKVYTTANRPPSIHLQPNP